MSQLIKELITIVLFKLTEITIPLLAVFVSLAALTATIFQLLIQREHNERSLRAIGQINLRDKLNLMYVHVINKGLGPMKVYQLTFTVNGTAHASIENCISASAKSYMHVNIDHEVNKTLAPNDYFEVFEKTYPMADEFNFDDSVKKELRQELSKIVLTVYYTDIHENKYQITRDLIWFARHISSNESVDSNPEHAG